MKFKINPEIVGFLDIKGKYEPISHIFECDLSGMQFHRAVEKAYCKKQQGNSPIPVIPYRIARNDTLRKKELNKIKVFHILKKDVEKFKNSYV